MRDRLHLVMGLMILAFILPDIVRAILALAGIYHGGH